MTNYNKILIKVNDNIKFDDYYVEVVIGGTLRLNKEETNKLAKTLWEYSWEIDGTFLAQNSKYIQDWVFDFPRTVVIQEVAKNLLSRLEVLFPDKVVIYE